MDPSSTSTNEMEVLRAQVNSKSVHLLRKMNGSVYLNYFMFLATGVSLKPTHSVTNDVAGCPTMHYRIAGDHICIAGYFH
jgi:hypothetical protein